MAPNKTLSSHKIKRLKKVHGKVIKVFLIIMDGDQELSGDYETMLQCVPRPHLKGLALNHQRKLHLSCTTSIQDKEKRMCPSLFLFLKKKQNKTKQKK